MKTNSVKNKKKLIAEIKKELKKRKKSHFQIKKKILYYKNYNGNKKVEDLTLIIEFHNNISLKSGEINLKPILLNFGNNNDMIEYFKNVFNNNPKKLNGNIKLVKVNNIDDFIFIDAIKFNIKKDNLIHYFLSFNNI
jgi:hypothetical protein